MSVPVFIINLENDRDSWETVADSIAKHGKEFEVHRIDAVEGRTIAIADRKDVDDELFHARNGREILAGEYGCYRSHLKALETFLAHGSPYGLILEDDVLFNKETPARIDAIVASFPNFSAIKLVNHRGRYMISVGETEEGDRIGRTMHGPQGSAAAYLVSRDGAQRLLKALATMSLPWDVALERFWSHQADVFSIDKDVLDFSPHRARSTIATGGGYEKAKYAWHKRFGTASFRLGEIFARAWHVMLPPFTGPTTALRTARLPIMPFWAQVVAGIVILTFVSAVWLETDAYRYAGLALILAALIYYLRADFWTYTKPLIGWPGLLCMIWAAYVGFRFAYVQLVYPSHGSGTAEGIYLLTFLYPTLGYAMLLFVRRPFAIALVFLAISLVVLVAGMDYTPSTGIRALPLLQNNPIHAAISSGLIALCALPIGLYALRAPGLSALKKTVAAAISFAAGVVALFAVYTLLSKGVWLAIVFAVPALMLTIILTDKSRWTRWAAAIAVAAMIASAFFAKDLILQTGTETANVSMELVTAVVSGEGLFHTMDAAIADPTTPSSERQRLMLWASALHMIAERPVLGAGISWLHHWEDRPYPEAEFNILHNGYLEIAVRYGMVGLAFYAFLTAWSFVRILQAVRAGLVDAVVLQCYCTTMVFFAVTLLSNSNVRLAIGESYMWLAVGVGFYCYYLLQRHGDIRPRTLF